MCKNKGTVLPRVTGALPEQCARSALRFWLIWQGRKAISRCPQHQPGVQGVVGTGGQRCELPPAAPPGLHSPGLWPEL